MNGTRGVFLLAALGSLVLSVFSEDRVGLIAWLSVWPVVALAGWVQRILEKAHPALAWWVAVCVRSGFSLLICVASEMLLGFEPGQCVFLWVWFLGHYLFSLGLDTILLVRRVRVRSTN